MHYDEFALFHENAEGFGIPYTGRPQSGALPPRSATAPAQRAGVGERAPELVLCTRCAERAHLGHGVASR